MQAAEVAPEVASVSVAQQPDVPIYEATFTKTAGQIAQAQEYLIRLGLHPGPSNGQMNPVTRDAIMAYQSANGLDTDGEITQRFMAHLANSMSVFELSKGAVQ